MWVVDFEQSQLVIALDTLFGLQIPLIDGDPQSAIERYALKFGELITARVHVETAALAKTLRAVSEKRVPVGDQCHVALTDISMDINRGLQGCRLNNACYRSESFESMARQCIFSDIPRVT